MLALPAFAQTSPPKPWFIAHLGDEPCVPLDSVDFNTFGRIGEHSGSIKTPEQLRASLQGVPGVRIEDGGKSPNGSLSFLTVTLPGARPVSMVLFSPDHEDMCRGFMAKIKP